MNDDERLTALARSLLDASTLCAIATVAPRGRAHVNTAYFAWSEAFELVWLSDPRSQHSRNIRARGTAAVAVYDSAQRWGRPDRGIQLFGTARELEQARTAEALYGARFADYTPIAAYRFYAFRPRRVKLFDERELGSAVFVSARVARARLANARSEQLGSAARRL